MDPAVEFRGIHKRYKLGSRQTSLREAISRTAHDLLRGRAGKEDQDRFVWALRDVSFSLERGGALGLIGPNGAGKTTALKILARITQPTSGEFTVRGRVSALIELGAGFHPDLTGRENVYLNAAILGLTREEVDESFDRIVSFSGLERFIDTPVKRYSSGMYVRLGFSVAAHVEPDVFLVDEVLAVGDAQFRQKCARRIEELQEKGTTIVFVAHNLYLVKSVCDRAIFIANGQIQAEGTAVNAISKYEDWLRDHEIKAVSKQPPTLSRKLEDDPSFSINAISVRDLNGGVRDEFTYSEALLLNLDFTASEPVKNPNLVLRLIRADGTTCSMIRTTDLGLNLDDLEGKGSLSLAIDPIQLAGGAYAFEAIVTGPIDGVPLASAHSSWFRVSGPSVSHHESSGVFIPNISWARVEDSEFPPADSELDLSA